MHGKNGVKQHYLAATGKVWSCCHGLCCIFLYIPVILNIQYMELETGTQVTIITSLHT